MLLGIDLGTSSVKAVVLAEDGSVEEVASASYPLESPAPGWAETDPGDWWLATRQAVRSLAASHRERIAAIGLSGQMHGVVLADADGQPLRPAILWADSRAEGELARYRELRPPLRISWRIRSPPAWPDQPSCGFAAMSPARTTPLAGPCSQRTGCACG